MLLALASIMIAPSITFVERPPSGSNRHYSSNRDPLQPSALTKLPITAFEPGGWVRRMLELQLDGLTGHLGELSKWLTKEDNAWLNPSGTGKFGWEEVPYWLRGYARVGYLLRDEKMLAETRVWVEGTLSSARADGDFGPVHKHSKGFRDLWAQMLMLQVLQSWYEHSGDERVLAVMKNYFHWQLALPEEQFLKDYWENSRGGDNLASVYWLYNLTGEKFLLELGEKIHHNTANWRLLGRLPNYHVVNIAQCFREPATYWQQSGKAEDLEASYRAFEFIREKFGQVPGGMFGADENARPGHDDPHQGTETCAFVEQVASNALLAAITGDPKWAANTEDVIFNSLPAAFTSDLRALRYLTAPNMVVSDGANHAPGMANDGPYLLMNPFSSRCCQHNHTSGWVNYVEGSWMATADSGLAVLNLYEGRVTAKVGVGNEVSIGVQTKYPFEETSTLTVERAASFPLYVLIPAWAKGATVQVGGEKVRAVPGKYARIEREWKAGDRVTLKLPMTPRERVWDQMKDSVSVDYGPLTFSLRIPERYRQVDSLKTLQWDAGWKENADPSKWPTFEILPDGPWNFGLAAEPRFEVVKKGWPKDGNPFTLDGTPLEIQATARRIPSWGMDQDGLVAILPKSPVETPEREERVTLVPMGSARLRISSFPRVK